MNRIRNSLLAALLILIGPAKGFSQDYIPVRTLPTEVFRTIKKDPNDTLPWMWKRGGLFSLNLAQGSLSNWAAGGDNFSMAIAAYANYFVFYRHGKHTWDNNFDFNFGFVQATSLGSRKNDDRLDFLSKYGYKVDTTGKLFLSALFNFRSQLFDGYTYSGSDPTFSSTFLSPAYFLLSAGMDYKPLKNLSIFLSPLTTRTTVVANSKLAALGLYGVKPGQHAVEELGAFSSITYATNFGKNITYKGRLDLFSNYLNKPQDIDLYMTNLVTFKINRYLSATYSLDMIYDDDVRLFGPDKMSPGLQLKSQIGIGLLLKLDSIMMN